MWRIAFRDLQWRRQWRRRRFVIAVLATLLVFGRYRDGSKPRLAVIAAFIPYYWLPIRGETASAKPQHHSRGHA